MNIALWIVQGLLALVMLGSGLAKSLMSKQRLAETGQTGVAHLSLPMIRFIATCELLGAVGMILPGSLGIVPILTPLAAVGFAIIMILAARIHARLREPRNVATNIVLLVMSVFVAIGRFPPWWDS